ncbi:MAG: ABC transporter substrate-binding protein [Pseudomonadota bacterium]
MQRFVVVGAALAALAWPAVADEPVKVGMIVTLSGPPAALGQHARDGFQLALDQLGGKFGDRDVELIVADAELKPDVAIDRARALVERDDVDFVVGTIFSNMLGAIFKPVTDSGTFLLSPNAGPSPFAGANCHEDFFAVSYQNDQNHEVLGRYAQDQGFERVFLLAPNYQAGRDSLAGFKRHFDGTVVDEAYVPLTQQDFSSEVARIAAADPEALFVFMPGGLGVRFVNQFRQSGLADRVAFLSAFTVDETTLPAQKDAALGFFGGGNWSPGLDTPGNAEFVEAFEAAYGYVPALYAMQGYDTAMLLDSVVRAVGGDLDDRDAVRAAIRAADFQSLRGDFSFNTNGYPIQDFYLLRVVARDDGNYQTEVVQQVFDDYGDVYAAECALD